jgi:hypothetical protein
MRALWIRVLLLAVLFNTVLGVPLHAAAHLHGLPGHEPPLGHEHAHGASGCDDAAVASSAHAHGAEADEEAPHGAHGGHGACTWCHSHAQLATALLGLAGLPLPAAAAAAPPAAAPAELGHAQALRWRYAARAPPPVH